MTHRPVKLAETDFQVVIMAKAPVSGEVKTRLCPPLTHEQAASLARAALLDTLDAVAASNACRRLVAWAGRLGTWVPAGFDVIIQRSGDFGSRLAGAVEDAWARTPVPVLVVGMDTPQLQGSTLDGAAAVLFADRTFFRRSRLRYSGQLRTAATGSSEHAGLSPACSTASL